MVKYDSDDWYFYLDFGVFVNLFGIMDQVEFDDVEVVLVLVVIFRIGVFFLFELLEGFGFFYFLVIYCVLFGDIYVWVGSIWEVDIFKGGSCFVNWCFIEQEGVWLMVELVWEYWFVGLLVDCFVKCMVWYMGELNVLYFFWDGNGCVLCEYVCYLVECVGYLLIWVGVFLDEMFFVFIVVYCGDVVLLVVLFLWQIRVVGCDD